MFAAEALIKTYEVHEEDPQCASASSPSPATSRTTKSCAAWPSPRCWSHPDPLTYQPKTELGKRLQKNVHWLYFNGGRYWTGYKQAVPKYDLAVLFSSFLMGEIAAATIFKQMYDNSREAVFRRVSRTSAATKAAMAICMAVMERDYPGLKDETKAVVTKQIRAGYLFLSAVLFEPPMEFWDLPSDFIANQREAEEVARALASAFRPTT